MGTFQWGLFHLKFVRSQPFKSEIWKVHTNQEPEVEDWFEKCWTKLSSVRGRKGERGERSGEKREKCGTIIRETQRERERERERGREGRVGVWTIPCWPNLVTYLYSNLWFNFSTEHSLWFSGQPNFGGSEDYGLTYYLWHRCRPCNTSLALITLTSCFSSWTKPWIKLRFYHHHPSTSTSYQVIPQPSSIDWACIIVVRLQKNCYFLFLC